MKTGIYKHYKGNLYDVIDTVTHSESEETLVLYRTMYGEKSLWVRPFVMFNETVEVNGVEVPRFKYIGKENE
ncbi:MAG TPA: DUF1653 domain-containing protein [Sulfurimonas sp.]|jgi:hypothetical protein|nr:MAG: hypothetical protein SPLUMA1_SPLUMAMAG1_00072 [uncultured Sulfurimonas sp.]CAI6165551.1 MAG: hypothetical protein SPLUMA2_SPLUMAMAG2_01266 [uncultured Sulfurimonas sp.]HIC12938.1 DUF1653 domain-containing protein [Sulfurimonas sp.]HIM75407.1 DUF1653 domain-containing protein [Campylobacterales bacterium]